MLSANVWVNATSARRVKACLSIQVDIALQETRNELIVRDTVLTGAGIDALNPQCSKIALLCFSVADFRKARIKK